MGRTHVTPAQHPCLLNLYRVSLLYQRTNKQQDGFIKCHLIKTDLGFTLSMPPCSAPTPPPLTVNPFGASWHTGHKGGRLSWRQPAVVSSRPALVGGVAIEDGLAVPDMAVRVGGAMTVNIRSKNVIFHGDSARSEDEAKHSFKICFHTFTNKQVKIQRSIFHHRISCVQDHGRGGAYLSYDRQQARPCTIRQFIKGTTEILWLAKCIFFRYGLWASMSWKNQRSYSFYPRLSRVTLVKYPCFFPD